LEKGWLDSPGDLPNAAKRLSAPLQTHKRSGAILQPLAIAGGNEPRPHLFVELSRAAWHCRD